MLPTPVHLLVPRQSSSSGGDDSSSGISTGSGSTDEFLNLISKPFQSQLSSASFVSAVIFSLVLSAVIGLAFSFIRPYNNVVYAPRAKHADSKHAPPPINKGIFGWIPPLIRTKEQDLVDKVGLDAALFMRFTRMMRNMFTALAIIACAVLIPTTLLASNSEAKSQYFFAKLTPQFVGGSVFWVWVVLAYVFDIIVCFFLWTNYRAVLRLRRNYFDSPEYQKSLHARTLVLTDIPKELRSDDGIVKITDDLKGTSDMPRAAIARNVKDLPELVEEHEKAVKGLEKHLAKYLKNPDKLPPKRPTCKVSTNDKAYTKGQEVDAIEYLSSRIKQLEVEIKEVRMSVDKRNAMSYGFASYESIPEAHGVAYVARRSGPQGTVIRLAPKPNDLLWKNLTMMKKERNWQNFINNLWVALLTVVWIVPNVLIAVFLSNLSHLGQVWPGFEKSLEAHPNFWGVVQGIVAPAITTAFYFFLPAIFRKLVTNAGDVTRTQRERHVMHKLFSFFVFNNLVVFSLFSAVWGFIATVIGSSKDNGNTWNAIVASHPFMQIIRTLITVTPYWCSWLLQRNLGSAIDLSQLVRLTWGSFSRRYLSPTPRELIELTAPQPFEYAGYYNYFLFYAAVTLCFGALQPLTFAITALYFWMDSFSKKYLLLYVFITKYESGGMFWRTLYNRMLVCVVLGNLVIALLVGAQGNTWIMPVALAPILVLLAGFKWYCSRTFDDQIRYYQKSQAMQDSELAAGAEHKRRKGDRVGVRFGHPVLYKPLITPMVSAKSQHMLKQVYSGRTSMDDTGTVAGYSDVYMDTMDSNKPGKTTAGVTPFEIVGEHQMDYEHWKTRPEFRDEAGELFGHPTDMTRPGTPSSMMTGPTRTGTWESNDSRSQSRSRSRGDDLYRSGSRDSDLTRVAGGGGGDAGGMEYPRGYHQTPSALREHSPSFGSEGGGGGPGSRGRYELREQDSREGLVSSAARMGRSPPPQLPTPQAPTPGGYGPIRLTPGGTPAGEDDGSHDYFRRSRGR